MCYIWAIALEEKLKEATGISNTSFWHTVSPVAVTPLTLFRNLFTQFKNVLLNCLIVFSDQHNEYSKSTYAILDIQSREYFIIIIHT